MDKEILIQKWLLGELSDEESKAFNSLDDASFYKRIVSNAENFKASNFSVIDDFDTFKEQIITPKTKVRKLNWVRPMLRIASVAIVIFGLYYLFMFNNMTEVQTLVAEKTNIQLPDESQIVLNALSQVSFNENKWDENRKIKLEGEAFFDVAKGSKFDVVTPTGTVSVLGTEFNVKQRDALFEVACFEGTVQVVANGYTKILHQGDNIRFFGGEVANGNQDYNEPKWTKNMSYFERIPVSEVFDELQRQYDISISIDNVNDQELFTGGFTHDNLKNALIGISEPMGIEFIIINHKEVRFSKRE